MTDDWSARLGESLKLFTASEAPWVTNLTSNTLRAGTDNFVTDGPCLHRTRDGRLLMLWSSFTGAKRSYAVGVAESTSGRIEGPWKQHPQPLFAENGGHCMRFRTFDGALMLALHQPNSGGNERARFFPVVEEGGTLRLATSPDANWWMKPRRLIQTNLREIDARMDLEAYVATLKDFGANVVLFNVGGIVANYPTDLPFHYRNPFMTGDYAGEVVTRLHAAGIRVIGRFDFSKVNEAIAREHPEWLSRDTEGNSFPPYNGQVPTCLNGGYQQDGMFQILGEALERYPLDGVFFNMIGYPRSDYSGRQLGICQCEGCRSRFKAMFELDLPRREAAGDPVYRKYQEFCQRTISEQFERVNQLVKGKRPDIAVCTYTAAGVDVIRMESNRPHHQWTYEDSERARFMLLNNPDRQLANAAVHFIHYPQRHSAVSPWLTQRRILQHLINGAWLDFYCIGPLHTLEDRLGLEQVRDIYRFHEANEHWLLDTVELADVGLVMDGVRGSPEYRGLYGILAEERVSFDLVSLERSDLGAYPALLVPSGANVRPEQAARLDNYVKRGGRLLVTGPPPTALQCVGVERLGESLPPTQGTYLRIRPEDKTRLAQPLLTNLDLVFLEGEFQQARLAADAEALLRVVPAAMFGPPEKCYYTNVSDSPALFHRRFGAGAVAWFPWAVGAHYDRQGHPGHAALVKGALTGLLELPQRVQVDASPLIEVNHRAHRDGRFEWVSLVNLSGQVDKVLRAPVPLRHARLRLKPKDKRSSVRLLKAGQSLRFELDTEGWLTCVVPEIRNYEVVLFER
jgi:hypothetical protein